MPESVPSGVDADDHATQMIGKHEARQGHLILMT